MFVGTVFPMDGFSRFRSLLMRVREHRSQEFRSCRREWLHVTSSNLRRGDGDSSAIHVQLLLAVVPNPGKDLNASFQVFRDGEWENLAVRTISIVSVRTVAFVRGHDVKCRAKISGEADQATTSVVIANPSDTPILLASSSPFSGWRALRGTKQGLVATAGIHPTIIRTTAIIRVLQVWVSSRFAIGIVGRVEWRWIEKLHVGSNVQRQCSKTSQGIEERRHFCGGNERTYVISHVYAHVV